jgi:hypothetical protein
MYDPSITLDDFAPNSVDAKLPLTPVSIAAVLRSRSRPSNNPLSTWLLAYYMNRSPSSVLKHAKIAHNMGLIVMYKTSAGFYYFTPEAWMKISTRRWDNSRYWTW